MKADRSVYSVTLAKVVASRAEAEQQGQLRNHICILTQNTLLIIVEINHLPLGGGGGNLFSQLINIRYEQGAGILTSNSGFEDWGRIFSDNVVAAALLASCCTMMSSAKSRVIATPSGNTLHSYRRT